MNLIRKKVLIINGGYTGKIGVITDKGPTDGTYWVKFVNHIEGVKGRISEHANGQECLVRKDDFNLIFQTI